jgi:type I restriction enzyme S subunit
MKSNWLPTRIGDICKTNQHTYAVSEKWPFINYLDTGNITENRISEIQHLVTGRDYLPSRARRKVSIDDILYSTVRPNQRHYGIVKKMLPNMLVSTGFTVISVNKAKADSDFLYYYLTQNDIVDGLHAIGEQSVSAYPSIKPSDIESIELILPPLTEQIEIGNTLKILDDKIANNNRINDYLAQTAKALFKSWFIDFEPFKDGEFCASEAGDIPTKWRALPVESVAQKVAMGPFGSNIKVETFIDSGVPIISGNHLRGLFLDEQSYNYISEEHAHKLNNSLVYAGDIIFTHAGNIGQVALIPNNCEYPYYIISQRQFYLRCDRQKALPEYINYYFHSREGQGKLLANTSSTGVPSIARPSSHLKSIVVPLPPIEVQNEWLNIVSPMIRAITQNIRGNKKLIIIRDALLPKLMSGELSVADI